MSTNEAVQLRDALKKVIDANSYDESTVENLSERLKLWMIGMELPTGSEEKQLYQSILEYAVIMSVNTQDKATFQRYIANLRPFYSSLTSRPSQNSSPTAIVIGLNLLYLLVENRLADFHCELELLADEFLSHPAIVFCSQLEKHLVVGSYDLVLEAAAQPPVQHFRFFLQSLLETVRVNIGECINSAYKTMTLAGATKFLMYNNQEDTLEFLQTNYPHWEIKDNTIYIQSATKVAKVEEIPSQRLITQTLSYATELERIV